MERSSFVRPFVRLCPSILPSVPACRRSLSTNGAEQDFTTFMYGVWITNLSNSHVDIKEDNINTTSIHRLQNLNVLLMRLPSRPIPVLYIPFLTPLSPVEAFVKQPVLVDHSQPSHPVIISLLGQRPVMAAKKWPAHYLWISLWQRTDFLLWFKYCRLLLRCFSIHNRNGDVSVDIWLTIIY